jgi:hypothetical protein
MDWRRRRTIRLGGLTRGVMRLSIILSVGFVAGAALAEPRMRLAAPHATPSNTAMPVAVFGSDDRVALPPKLRPVRDMIGVLFNLRQRTVCSAFCVAPDMIGTAGHCLFKAAGEKAPRLADFWFARNYDAMRDYARVAGFATGAASQNVIAGGAALSTAPPIDATRDWAFIRLSRPVCSKGVLEIEAAPVEQIVREAKAGQVYQISYHRDFVQWQPAYSKPCSFEKSFGGVAWPTIAADFREADNLLLHTCDTGGASSGSPLLMDTAKGPRVIGINVGTYVRSRTLVQDGKVPEKLGTDAVANTGVASIAFARQLTAFRAASILVGVAPIKDLQERLKAAGHYTGPIDGTYGQALKYAIEAFETASKVPVTGLASTDVLTRLRGAPASAGAAAINR